MRCYLLFNFQFIFRNHLQIFSPEVKLILEEILIYVGERERLSGWNAPTKIKLISNTQSR